MHLHSLMQTQLDSRILMNIRRISSICSAQKAKVSLRMIQIQLVDLIKILSGTSLSLILIGSKGTVHMYLHEYATNHDHDQGGFMLAMILRPKIFTRS